ncbi:uncharacterized protein LOC135401156 isoform X2 [Ornithodoros turicata]|uniref:uncharacterized protein LOC135401156 isoform X2 n=1 Tax=Ornithodoros turicata TaxID=34597 RepID=UPI00313A2680
MVVTHKQQDLGPDLDKYNVCSRHFISGSPSQLLDECNPDWAPCLHLGYDSRGGTTNGSRYKRLKQRQSAVGTTATDATSGSVSSILASPEPFDADALSDDMPSTSTKDP